VMWICFFSHFYLPRDQNPPTEASQLTS
jgi:hypothetical protein